MLLGLERQFGLCGTALMWFRSYLFGMTYRVVYAGGTSSVVYVVCSVPQGSVLGPVLFVLYVADLADIINRQDDTQLYLHCCREDITTAATRLKECIIDVGRWMSANRLKLNTDKTELFWTGSRHSISQLHGHGPSIQLGTDTVPACDHVWLLGVIISADLSLDRHVSVVSSASFYWLWQLRRVRRSLDDESAGILVHAFVTSRVDYCNLLLAGAPKSVTDKLQWVMNAAARVVSGTKKYDHGLTHLLHSELHWLDVADRVTYKLGVTVYQCLHGQHRIICLSCAHRLLKLLNDSIFVPPAAIYSFHGFNSIRTAVAPSLSLDQRHGTCSKTICVSWTRKLTVFVVHWRHFFLISTRHIEHIRGVFLQQCAI